MSTEPQYVEKFVRIIAIPKKYRQIPFPFTVPRGTQSGRFITGQELSEEKMFGKDKLTAPERRRLGFSSDGDSIIINPDYTYPLVHGRRFDLSSYKDKDDLIYRNGKDHAEFDFFTSQTDLVAPTKKDVIPDKHIFYVEDLEAEAAYDVKKMDKFYEALSLLYNTPTSDMSDIALLLSYEADGFNVNPDVLTPTQLKSRLLQEAEKHPEIILKFKENDAKETVFALRLVKNGLVRKAGRDFYYGSTFLGSTIQSVKDFVSKKENAGLVDKWAKVIKVGPFAEPVKEPAKAETE